MVFAARAIIIGGSRFTSQEAQFIRAAVRSGLTRESTRAFVRTTFQRGISNEAFSGFRTLLSGAERAGIQMTRLRPGARLDAESFSTVRAINPTANVVISTTVRVRFPRTGTFRDIVIRAGFDETPDEAQFQARMREIVNKGHQGESSVEIEGELRTPDFPRTVIFQDAVAF